MISYTRSGNRNKLHNKLMRLLVTIHDCLVKPIHLSDLIRIILHIVEKLKIVNSDNNIQYKLDTQLGYITIIAWFKTNIKEICKYLKFIADTKQ